jgi:hypothetical protein
MSISNKEADDGVNRDAFDNIWGVGRRLPTWVLIVDERSSFDTGDEMMAFDDYNLKSKTNSLFKKKANGWQIDNEIQND